MADDPADDRPPDRAGDGASGSPRLAAPADDAPAPRLPFPVVGVGASAGGLEAYSELIDALPADTGAAFVLVQHLPPDRESLLVELLARRTRMPVVQVEDGLPVHPDHVYVIRPGRTLTLADGRLRLSEPLAARGHGRPIDDFFRSLAEEQQQRAVAVVLSGMGSNGTAGAEAVKAVGGLVVAQEPESAKYPSMPRSLIDQNLADTILRPADMPAALVRYFRHPYTAGVAVGQRDRQALADILAVLRTRTRQDFAGYRKGTLLRRVQRRMGLAQLDDVGEYARLLRRAPTEVAALADDLLIHVTGFFRDPDAWAALYEKVIDPLAAERPDGAAVRAWVAACATGEEAYTLAMLLLEAAAARGKRFDVKVFATDMAERALGLARAGVFPNGIESEVSADRLGRFFDKDDSFYRVKKELREAVIFAPQNVLQDPPFSRLDVVTCRNLPIYLEPETQRRVLALLHFGLREGGALMLGTSESAGAAEGADFEPIDKKHRLYRRVGPTRHGTLDFPLPLLRLGDGTPAVPDRPAGRPPLAQAAHRLLLDHFAPAAVVADADGQVVYFHGETGRYLRPPAGEPTRDLFALAHEQVRGAIRTALHKAVGRERPVVVRDGLIDTPDGRRRIEVAAIPLDRPPEAAHYLLTFTDHPDPPPGPPLAPDAPGEARMAEELRRVRDELQSTVEELQTSNEELKASHEEVTSVNEELQSTNEELETSKEELQSLNEELVTVNAQLQAKMAELEATSNDLGSLLASTDIAVLFLDPRFRIRRYTPATKDLLDLIPSDVGRPLSDLRRKFADPDLLADAQAVLDRLAPVEREVGSDSGRAYVRRVLPYRTQDDRIDGVVVTFVDITDRQATERALAAQKEYAESIVETLHEPLLVLHPDLTVKGVNPAFYTHFRVDPADTVGRKVYELGSRQWDIPALRTLLEDVLPDSNVFNDYEVTYEFEGIGRRVMLVNGRRLDHVQLILLGIRDITDRKRAEDVVRASEERQAFLLKLSDALRAEPDADAVADRALRMLSEQLRLDRCYVGVYRPADDRADLTHQVGNDRVPPLPGRIRLSDFPEALRVAADRTLVIDDVAATAGLSDTDRRNITALGLRALVAAGLREGEGNPLWTLVAVSATPRGWTRDEVALAEEVAERTWAAVERAKAEAALRASEAKYRTLFETMGQGFAECELVRGPDGRATDNRYVEVNPAFERLTGVPADRARGRTMCEVFPGIQDWWVETFDRIVRGGRPERLEYEVAPLGRWYQAHIYPRAGDRFIALYEDITDRKQAELVVRESEERQAFLLKLSDALRPLADPVEIIATATRLLGEGLAASRAYYAEWPPGTDSVEIRRDYAAAGLPSLVGRYPIEFFRSTDQRFREGGTWVVKDAADGTIAAAERDYCLAHGVAAWVNVPLVKGGELQAALFLVQDAPRCWNATEIALAEETAERTWAAVERAKAEAAVRANEDRSALLVRFADAARGLSDPGRVAEAACRLLTAHLGTERTLWAGIDWATREYVAEYVVLADGSRGEPSRWPLDPGQPFAAEHLAGRAVAYDDAATDPRIPDPARAAMAGRGLRAGIAVPVRVDGTLRAVLCTSQPAAPRRWRPEEVAVVEALAGRAWAEIERAKAEAAVRQSEEQFRRAIEEAPIPVIMHAEDGEVLQVSRSWTELTGYTLEDRAVLQTWLTRAYGSGGDDVREAVERSFGPPADGGPMRAVVFDVTTRAGERRTWSFSASSPGALRDGRRFVVGMAEDITTRQQAEDRLRASEERLRAVAANLPSAAVFVVGPDLRYVLAAGEALAAAGFAPADLEGKPLAEVLAPTLLAAYEPNYRAVLAGGTFRAEHGSHGRHYVTHGAPLRDPNGRVTAALAVSYDITDRVRAEEAERQSEERFRVLVANVRDHALFAFDPAGTVTSWNDGAERLFGYTAAEAVGGSADRFFTPADRAAGMPEDERATAAAAGRATDENWAVRKDGSRFWASGSSSAVRDAAGRLTGFVKVVRDRTDAQAAEDAVRRAEGRLRLALDAARTGIWEWTVAAGTHVRDANLNRLLGLPAVESVGTYDGFLRLVHPDDRDRVDAVFRAAVDAVGELNTEFRVVHADGSVRWLRDQGAAVAGADGRAVRLAGACVDITDRKAVEDALRQARDELEERVRARTAELASAYSTLQNEVAERQALLARLNTAQEDERRRVARELHDGLGQYLAALSIGLTTARDAAAGPAADRLADLADLADEAGREAHRLAVELRPTALDDLGLRAAVQQYVERWAERAGVPAEFDSRGLDGERFPGPAATAVYRAVQEALTNVMRHARAARVSVLLDRGPGHLSAIVEDDGVGFDPDAVGRREGGGLGLPGMRERVALVGGTVHIESAPGAGTAVYVRVPVPPAGGGAYE